MSKNFAKLKELVLNSAKQEIEEGFANNESEITLYFCRPNDVVNTLKESENIDFQELVDWDCNGNDWDYCFYLKANNESWELLGDGYRKHHCVLSKSS